MTGAGSTLLSLPAEPSELSRQSLLAVGGGPAVMDWEGDDAAAAEDQGTCVRQDT